MDLADVLLQRYPGIRSNLKKSVHDSLSEEEIRKSPAGMTSIAWNIWHLARVEDIGITRMVSDGEQLFDKEGWGKKLNYEHRYFGTGMSAEEAAELSEKINLKALKEYHDAVEQQTLKFFEKLSSVKLEEKLDPDYLQHVLIDEGVLHKNALWVHDVYKTKTRAWFLVHMILTHNFEHLGQIMLLRKLLGHEGTR